MLTMRCAFVSSLDTVLTLTNAAQRMGTLLHFAVLNEDRKSTRLNSSHSQISYAVFCLKKKTDSLNLVVRDHVPCPLAANSDLTLGTSFSYSLSHCVECSV